MVLMSAYLNTQERCKRVVENDPYTLKFVPDYFNTEEICEKAASDDPSSLQMFLIGLSQGSKYKFGMLQVNMVIIFLSGTRVRRLKKPH